MGVHRDFLQALRARWESESALWCLTRAGSCMMLLAQPGWQLLGCFRTHRLRVWQHVWPTAALGHLNCFPACPVVWLPMSHAGLTNSLPERQAYTTCSVMHQKHCAGGCNTGSPPHCAGRARGLLRHALQTLRRGLPDRVSTTLCRRDSRRATRKHRRDSPIDADVHSDPEALLRAGRAALSAAAAAEGPAAKRHKAGLGQAVCFAQAVEVIVHDSQTKEQGPTADRAAGEVKRPEVVSCNKVRCSPAWGSGRHMPSSLVVMYHGFCMAALGLCWLSILVQRFAHYM